MMIKPEVTIVVDSQTIGVDVLSPALDIELGISNAPVTWGYLKG